MKKYFSALIATVVIAIAAYCAIGEHQHLKVKNDFKMPVDVVKYYCARDASGYIPSFTYSPPSLYAVCN